MIVVMSRRLAFVIGLGLGFDATFATVCFVAPRRLEHRVAAVSRSLDQLRSSVDRTRDDQRQLKESLKALQYDLGEIKIDVRDGGPEDDNGGDR